MSEFIILVSGSRDWLDVQTINEELNFIQSKLSPDKTPVLIHGDARGVDKICDAIAKDLKWSIRKYPITSEDWKTQGKRAGPMRNLQMITTEQPHAIIAFRKNKSPGTTSTIKYATNYSGQLFSRLVYFKVFDEDIKNDSTILSTHVIKNKF